MKGKRELFMRKAKEKTQELLTSRDGMVIHISKTIKDLEEVVHQLEERLEGMYGTYFPEFKMGDKERFVKVVLLFDKDNPLVDSIQKVIGENKAEEIVQKAKTSIGAKLTQGDMEKIKELAETILSLYNLKKQYEKYLSKLTKEICPNLDYLAGSKLAGELLSVAGGLKKLAFMPASTVQVIGAERALFKHLRNKKVNPPKHGIIFQHPLISTASKKQRGKIARILAAKFSLAARADHYTKRFIAEELKVSLDKRVAEIHKIVKE